jgi:hypothetical protein
MSTHADRFPAAKIEAQSERGLFRGILVASDKVAERYGKAKVFSVKWVNAEQRLKPHHDDRKAKRIESRFEECKLVCEWRELHALFCGDLSELSNDLGSDVHMRPTELLGAPVGGC